MFIIRLYHLYPPLLAWSVQNNAIGTVVRLLLKKPSLDPRDLNNYRQVSNLPFLGKAIERVVAHQLQAVLDDTDFLDPFQTSFRAGYEAETATVALVGDLCLSIDRGSVSLLVLLDRSVAFDTIDHVSFLNT